MIISNALQNVQEKWFAAISEAEFVQRLEQGTLTQAQRDYYVAQDHFYLNKFDSVFTETNHILNELGLKTVARNTNEWEAHQALQPSDLWETHAIGLTSRAYVRFLEQVFQTTDKLHKLLAVLPCLESYHLLACQMKNNIHYHEKHPYKGWVDYYTGTLYRKEVLRNQKGILLLMKNRESTERILVGTIQIYEKAYQYEYEFWQQCLV